jgi:hypothetical protein
LLQEDLFCAGSVDAVHATSTKQVSRSAAGAEKSAEWLVDEEEGFLTVAFLLQLL